MERRITYEPIQQTLSFAGQASKSSWRLVLLFGQMAAGKAVNERTAMQTTAVYACVRILAESIACLPLAVYCCSEAGKEIAYEHPLYFLLHDAPNSEMTPLYFAKR